MNRIESGIPIPISPTRKGITATLKELRVGDSFWISTSIRSLYNQAKRAGVKITGRAEVKDGVSGHRIWRVE